MLSDYSKVTHKVWQIKHTWLSIQICYRKKQWLFCTKYWKQYRPT